MKNTGWVVGIAFDSRLQSPVMSLAAKMKISAVRTPVPSARQSWRPRRTPVSEPHGPGQLSSQRRHRPRIPQVAHQYSDSAILIREYLRGSSPSVKSLSINELLTGGPPGFIRFAIGDHHRPQSVFGRSTGLGGPRGRLVRGRPARRNGWLSAADGPCQRRAV